MRSFGTALGGDTELSETDFEVLLIYLSRDMNAISYDGKVWPRKYSLCISAPVDTEFRQ